MIFSAIMNRLSFINVYESEFLTMLMSYCNSQQNKFEAFETILREKITPNHRTFGGNVFMILVMHLLQLDDTYDSVELYQQMSPYDFETQTGEKKHPMSKGFNLIAKSEATTYGIQVLFRGVQDKVFQEGLNSFCQEAQQKSDFVPMIISNASQVEESAEINSLHNLVMYIGDDFKWNAEVHFARITEFLLGKFSQYTVMTIGEIETYIEKMNGDETYEPNPEDDIESEDYTTDSSSDDFDDTDSSSDDDDDDSDDTDDDDDDYVADNDNDYVADDEVDEDDVPIMRKPKRKHADDGAPNRKRSK